MVVFDLGGSRRVSVAICYESVLRGCRAFVQRGSGLRIITNDDGWPVVGGVSTFEQGAIRAVEEGRFVVRAANTRNLGVVDPYGRVVTSTNLFETAAFVADVRLLNVTTVYSRFGDLIVWLSLLVSAGVIVYRSCTIADDDLDETDCCMPTLSTRDASSEGSLTKPASSAN